MESWKVWPCDIAALTLTDLHFFKRRWREKKNQLKIGTVTEQSNYLLKESPSPQVLWAMSEPPISVKDWMKCSLFEYDVSSFSRYEFPSKSFSLAAMNFPANISQLGLGWPMALVLAMRAFVTHSWLVAFTILISCRDSPQLMGLGLDTSDVYLLQVTTMASSAPKLVAPFPTKESQVPRRTWSV